MSNCSMVMILMLLAVILAVMVLIGIVSRDRREIRQELTAIKRSDIEFMFGNVFDQLLMLLTKLAGSDVNLHQKIGEWRKMWEISSSPKKNLMQRQLLENIRHLSGDIKNDQQIEDFKESELDDILADVVSFGIQLSEMGKESGDHYIRRREIGQRKYLLLRDKLTHFLTLTDD